MAEGSKAVLLPFAFGPTAFHVSVRGKIGYDVRVYLKCSPGACGFNHGIKQLCRSSKVLKRVCARVA